MKPRGRLPRLRAMASMTLTMAALGVAALRAGDGIEARLTDRAPTAEVAGFAGATTASSSLPLSQGDLRRLLAEAVRESGVPGMVARLATADSFVASSFGKRERGAAPAFAVGDPVHVGSCLKAMTATVAARLVEHGALRWETTVAEAFPELAAGLPGAVGSVTIEELLAHRGGFTDDVPDELIDEVLSFRGSGRAARERFVPPYLALQPGGARGAYSYSNLGYMVAGAMLERATGSSYDDLLRRELLMPLRMRSARQGAPGSNDPARIDAPRGHDADGRPLLPVQQIDPPVIAPAGTWSMTLADWSSFALAQAGVPVRGHRLLTAESLARLQSPVGGPVPELANAGYGLGWVVAEANGVLLLLHDGSNEAWLSRVVINPAADRVLLVSTNQAGAAAEAALDRVTLDPRVLGWLVGQ